MMRPAVTSVGHSRMLEPRRRNGPPSVSSAWTRAEPNDVFSLGAAYLELRTPRSSSRGSLAGWLSGSESGFDQEAASRLEDRMHLLEGMDRLRRTSIPPAWWRWTASVRRARNRMLTSSPEARRL